jgi:Flp pilus assembly protein TadD
LGLWVLCVCLAAPAHADTLADARRLADAGQTEQALRLVEQSMTTRPADAPLQFFQGVLLADLGRSDEAMAIFERLSQNYPELPDPLNNLAVLHAARGELDAATELLKRALRNAPGHRSARENLGDVYLRMAIREWTAAQGGALPQRALTRKLEMARGIEALASAP